ncbi:D-hexose-6-phosphate mutarotase [Chromobacterium sp. S0633]|uniref:D-hexose-6-phosphate mutarotase n=1 Tax=Chromobacterium sp. S0633 TaxID=2957805 RepID=UPI00209E4325|nr:D-hexose-6-phosphate mutarotase [Chromobacterium sp. S0633]MCP1291197.1 D-hexose-6-phosphate mutarotase [Chromobacterium sp. S0633]
MSVALPPAAALSSRAPGVDILVISAADFHAEISLLGGQLLSFRAAGQQPLLYLSPQARYLPGKAIRGGVPLCWPWFGPHPDDASLPAHGVARTQAWRLDEVREDAGAFHVKLSGPECDGLTAEMEYRLGAAVEAALTTRNLGDRPQRLGAALHSYLAVGDARQAALSGLDGERCHDKVAGRESRWPDGEFRFRGEVDSIVYSERPALLRDPVWRRCIRVTAEGAGSVVVWNPAAEKTALLGDLPDAAWLDFVCVETANAGDDVRLLAPGASHRLACRLTLEPFHGEAGV